MEANDGFIRELSRDPLVGYISTNFSYMRPYGVWWSSVPSISPAALTGGRSGQHGHGNTIVIKPATIRPGAPTDRDVCATPVFPLVFSISSRSWRQLGRLDENPDVAASPLPVLRCGHEDLPRFRLWPLCPPDHPGVRRQKPHIVSRTRPGQRCNWHHRSAFG